MLTISPKRFSEPTSTPPTSEARPSGPDAYRAQVAESYRRFRTASKVSAAAGLVVSVTTLGLPVVLGASAAVAALGGVAAIPVGLLAAGVVNVWMGGSKSIL